MSDTPFVIHLLAWLFVTFMVVGLTMMILFTVHTIIDMIKEFWR